MRDSESDDSVPLGYVAMILVKPETCVLHFNILQDCADCSCGVWFRKSQWDGFLSVLFHLTAGRCRWSQSVRAQWRLERMAEPTRPTLLENRLDTGLLPHIGPRLCLVRFILQNENFPPNTVASLVGSPVAAGWGWFCMVERGGQAGRGCGSIWDFSGGGGRRSAA
jgi:hypothetical protein